MKEGDGLLPFMSGEAVTIDLRNSEPLTFDMINDVNGSYNRSSGLESNDYRIN